MRFFVLIIIVLIGLAFCVQAENTSYTCKEKKAPVLL